MRSSVRSATKLVPKPTVSGRSFAVVAALLGALGVLGLARDVGDRGLMPLPQPVGPAFVGTSVVRLPIERAGPALGNEPVQMWYPTSATSGKPAPYAYGVERPLRNRLIDSLVRTESFMDAPIASGRFPIVLYVPGIGGYRSANSALAQDLASVGYVVVAFNDERPPNGGTVMTSAASVERSIRWADARLGLGTRDLSRALDALARLDADRHGRFFGSLAVDRVGIVGFSFGGSLAAEFARYDPRVAAAVNLGGWMFGRAVHDGVPRPYLFVSSAPLRTGAQRAIPPDADAATAERVFNYDNEAAISDALRRRGGYVLAIGGFGHFNFTDAALTPSLRHTGRGSIDPVRGHRIVSSYVRTFMDRYVRGANVALMPRPRLSEDAVALERFVPARTIGR